MDEKFMVTQSWIKEYICPVHGDISTQTLNSRIKEFEMHLCLRCCLEKLIEIGVQRVEEKNK